MSFSIPTLQLPPQFNDWVQHDRGWLDDVISSYETDMQQHVASTISQMIIDRADGLQEHQLGRALADVRTTIRSWPTPAQPFNEETIKEEALKYVYSSLHGTDEPTARDLCPDYNARIIRRERRREREQEMVRFGKVKYYSSSRARRDSRQQDKRNDRIMSKRFLITKDDQRVPMNEVAKRSAEHHVYETLARIESFSKTADYNNWLASFVVVTAQSAWHRCSKSWDGSMPDEVHERMQQKWKLVIASLNDDGLRAGDDFVFVRTVEPHKDGTPHYNLVFIASADVTARFRELITEHYYDRENPTETTLDVRIKWRTATGEKAARQIAAYACKYSFKNCNHDSHRDDDKRSEAEAARAWRQSWGIRAFAFGGLAPVSLWRECRNGRYDHLDHPIVHSAQETDFFQFQQEWLQIKKQMKPIVELVMNRYNEEVRKIIGHKLLDDTDCETIICKLIENATIVEGFTCTYSKLPKCDHQTRIISDPPTSDPPSLQ